MAKTSKPADNRAGGKEKKQRGKPKGSTVPLGALGAGVALAVALAAGAAIYTKREKQVAVTFRNPSSAQVHLFADSGAKVASLPPGGAVETRAAPGSRLFFSPDESGSTRTHAVEVGLSLLEYSYNPNCRDLHDPAGCSNFASWGSCTKNPGWMSVNCAATCSACHLMDPQVRCSFDRLGMSESHLAVEPGGIGRMFESLPQRFPQYGVRLLSVEPDGPFVATFDTFVTSEEARVVRELTAPHLARSTDQGEIDPSTGVQAKITSSGRTSSNSWCDESTGCARHPVVQNLIQKISEVVQVPEENFEYMQVLQYDKGQYYNAHHDAGAHDFKLPSGPRLYTMFLYFDDVEEGGGTSFPSLNLTVEPARGKALLWPSCLNDRPYEIDQRTIHAALPVVKGRKLAANVWVRQRDYKKPNLWGCTGTFG